jgi:hypothetical protein
VRPGYETRDTASRNVRVCRAKARRRNAMAGV